MIEIKKIHIYFQSKERRLYCVWSCLLLVVQSNRVDTHNFFLSPDGMSDIYSSAFITRSRMVCPLHQPTSLTNGGKPSLRLWRNGETVLPLLCHTSVTWNSTVTQATSSITRNKNNTEMSCSWDIILWLDHCESPVSYVLKRIKFAVMYVWVTYISWCIIAVMSDTRLRFSQPVPTADTYVR